MYREDSPFFILTFFFTMHQSHCLCVKIEVTNNINMSLTCILLTNTKSLRNS